MASALPYAPLSRRLVLDASLKTCVFVVVVDSVSVSRSSFVVESELPASFSVELLDELSVLELPEFVLSVELLEALVEDVFVPVVEPV